MNSVLVVCKRELSSFFFSPIAYVVLGVWSLFMGGFFSSAFAQYGMISMQLSRNPQLAAQYNITPTSWILSQQVFASVSVTLLFITPLLTMKLFSEEKKQGTMEMLLTYPIKDTQILLGKFFSVVCIYLLMLSVLLIYPVLLSTFVRVEWSVIASSFLGIFLMGCSFLSVGLLASSWTSNQIIAAMSAFMILLLSFIVEFLSASAPAMISAVLRQMSIGLHLKNFVSGIIDTRDIVFFLSLIFVCLFLSLRSLESHRWRG